MADEQAEKIKKEEK